MLALDGPTGSVPLAIGGHRANEVEDAIGLFTPIAGPMTASFGLVTDPPFLFRDCKASAGKLTKAAKHNIGSKAAINNLHTSIKLRKK